LSKNIQFLQHLGNIRFVRVACPNMLLLAPIYSITLHILYNGAIEANRSIATREQTCNMLVMIFCIIINIQLSQYLSIGCSTCVAEKIGRSTRLEQRT